MVVEGRALARQVLPAAVLVGQGQQEAEEAEEEEPQSSRVPEVMEEQAVLIRLLTAVMVLAAAGVAGAVQ